MLIVLCTCPDLKTAEKIATELVEKRLAACVNIIKIEKSIYRWKGKTRAEREYLLIIKTTKTRYPRLETRIKSMHPYDVPEIIGLKIEKGNNRYIEWVKRSCLA